MSRFFHVVLLLVALGAIIPLAFAAESDVKPKNASHTDQSVISTDVCIIGGGSSGTYAAVRLHDIGMNIVLIEREPVLGGHTNTYIDPRTNEAVDYGVIDFRNLPVAQNYFRRLDVSFSSIASSSDGAETYYVDLKSGRLVPNSTLLHLDAIRESLVRYARQAAQFTALEYGFYLPDPVPEELLMPFGEFVNKYNTTGVLQMMYPGFGDILQQPTLYVMKYYGADMLRRLFEGGFISTSSRNNSEIYDKALQFLQPNVLLQSEIIRTDRRAADHITVHVRTPSGGKIIWSKKLLVTIPPQLTNLKGFDLDPVEEGLFSQFHNVAYYTGLVRNTGLPDDVVIRNAAPNTPANLPSLPGLYQIVGTSIPGLFEVEYGSPWDLSEEAVKSDILESIARLKEKCGLTVDADKTPELVAFQSHTPFLLTVSPEEIRSGFYQRLYGLQGHRNTFYTGAAFHAQDSALLWRFTEGVVSDLVRSLAARI